MKRYVEQAVYKDIKKKLVILTGPRQVGKTYMSRQLMSYYQNPLYLHWDIPDHRVRLQKQDWYDLHDLVVMDEILDILPALKDGDSYCAHAARA